MCIYQHLLCDYYEISLRNNMKENPVQWLEKAAELGLVDAEVELGDYYLGEDDAQAVIWLTKAAKKGNLSAIKTPCRVLRRG